MSPHRATRLVLAAGLLTAGLRAGSADRGRLGR